MSSISGQDNLIQLCLKLSKMPALHQIVTLRLSYKLSWPESRMVVNSSADWGEEGEINISPDNIEVKMNISPDNIEARMNIKN